MSNTTSRFSTIIEPAQTPGLAEWRNKRVIVVPTHFKIATDLIMRLLLEDVNVVALSAFLKHGETFRSTLPKHTQQRFQTIECDLHSIAGMRMTISRIRKTIGDVHLLIVFLPKRPQDMEACYQPNNELRLQRVLDVSLASARTFLHQAERELFMPCCEHLCSSELMWIVRYTSTSDEVVEHLIARMCRTDIGCHLNQLKLHRNSDIDLDYIQMKRNSQNKSIIIP